MFKVLVERKAGKFFSKVDDKTKIKLLQVLRTLETDPVPFRTYDIVKMKGYQNHFRIRLGKIRIIYEILKEEFTIKVWDIDFRGRIY